MRRGVSVVVPCRNGAEHIGSTLRAVLNQTEPPEEIIVIDDGSSDATRAIALAFGAPVVVRAGPARGAAVARNAGAASSRGARLLFLDADDLLTPGTLAALGAALDDAPREALALCPWERLERGGDAGEPMAPWLICPASNALPRPGQDPLAAWLTGTWSPPCCVLWTRAGFAAAGGWWQGAGLDDDGNLLRRAMARGVARVPAPGGLALHRRAAAEAPSYSGRRLQPWGLAVRLASLTDTVAALEEAGRLGDYRAPLHEALAEIARDAALRAAPGAAVEAAGGDAGEDVRARLIALAARIGPRRSRDGAVAAAGRLGARGRAWLDERRAPTRIARHASVGREPPAPPAPPAPADRPLVSVIIPTFERAERVVEAVRSVLAQSYDAIELIVVDDGSTDDTQARLARIDDPRLHVIVRENGGVARARNTGMAAARGGYVAFLDSDDAWRPDKLGRQLALLGAAGPRTGFCHTGIEMRRDGRTTAIRHATMTGECLTGLLLTNAVHAPTSSGMVRREVLDAVGGFDPDLPAAEDWDWLQRVARLYDLAAVDAPLTIYNDDATDDRRSRAFRSNMNARERLWERNRHALRRIGAGHLYLLESARRELREPEGDAAKGRALVARAFHERPQARSTWPWLVYALAPAGLRRWLRDRDAVAHARRRSARRGEVRPD